MVNTMLRHAALYGAAYGWDPQVAAATRLDSALTTTSTKFLVASIIAQAAEPQIAELGPLIEGSALFPRAPGSAALQRPASACQRIAPLMASLDVASARLRDGGDRHAGGSVSQIVAGIAAERERLGALRDSCTRNP
jgi:hypothetical protein